MNPAARKATSQQEPGLQRYQDALRHADAMARIGSTAYWRAYKRGLQRARFGSVAVSIEEHEAFLSLGDSTRADHAERGRGYSDGLRALADGR